MTEDMPQGKKTVSDEEIVKTVSEHPDPVVSAHEVADIFGHTRQWAHERLSELADLGEINRKRSGSRSVMWWVED